MTASEISSIVLTVAVVQLICDLIAHFRIFKRDRYGRLVAAYERAKWKKEKAWKDAIEAGVVDPKDPAATIPKAETAVTAANKQSKKAVGHSNKDTKQTRLAKAYQRADQDCTDAGPMVARQHILPNMLTSIVFVILMRILGTEYKGRILAILPFTPWKLVQRLFTSRGLKFRTDLKFESTSDKVTDIQQAASFMLIYMLAALSVKYYISQLVGTKPPPGADGLTNLTNSSWGKRVIKQVGLDPRDLKLE
ncbi:hypothetical protein ACA910_014213 [Epithemia clementina (nom. ined.)]